MKMHITIQQGRASPESVCCQTCCSQYHCPFCSVNLFHPTTLKKVQLHLDHHFNRAVSHEGYTIHRCGLGCREQLHYHCFKCQKTHLRRADFERHSKSCIHRASTPASSPGPSPSTPAPSASRVMSRSAVVCGGSRGIGEAVSRSSAEKGCRVAVVSRNQDTAMAVVATLHGADHKAFSCDVSKEQQVQETFETIQKTCGNISYLVNAAGINRDASLSRMKAEDMVDVLHTNSSGSMSTCRAASRSMSRTQGAAIVNIGSVVGSKGNSGQCAYSTSKAGSEGLTRSLAKEVASRNIRVNSLAPGFIHTDMTAGSKEEAGARSIPSGRFGTPEEVAQAVLFLLHSSYITGQVSVVDGGSQLAM